MEILLTLPELFANYIRKNKSDFPDIADVFSDPKEKKLGSGGGTVNVLWQSYKRYKLENDSAVSFSQWLGLGKRIIIHSDGQSRRLPAYAPTGKSFIPFPVFKWGRGQHIRQTLFDVQKPLLQNILEKAPAGMNTLIASGDALVYADMLIPAIPLADVVCVGVWTQAEVASKHGVFICPRQDPSKLEFMLQKPSIDKIQSLINDFLFLLDAGIWILSDKAVELLFANTGWNTGTSEFASGLPDYYDLYSDFGTALGRKPEIRSGEIKQGIQNLETRILNLDKAEFYHFGSNSDLVNATNALHNRVIDQREIWHKKIKPSPDIFIQNAVTSIQLTPLHHSLWIENSHIPSGWTLHNHHIVTGIPENNWSLEVNAGKCLDIVPIGDSQWCIRFYGYSDTFKGEIRNPETKWMGEAALIWFSRRGIEGNTSEMELTPDIYTAGIFPVVGDKDLTQEFVNWLITDDPGKYNDKKLREFYLRCRRISCEEIIEQVNLKRFFSRLNENLKLSLNALSKNSRQSIFYQLDLKRLVGEFIELGISIPAEVPQDAPLMTRIHDSMMREVFHENIKSKDKPGTFEGGSISPGFYEEQSFSLLRNGMMEDLRAQKLSPSLNLQPDQILWGRSPVRLDLAGGWTDTPPYCILFGGKVVNMAVELNGQPPLQVFIKPNERHEISIRSIDLGVSEVIRNYSDLDVLSQVGSAFAIPKAALVLCGFHQDFSAGRYKSLKDQLKDFGSGFDISLMVAVPKGSGLGTSSILAASILGALSEFCKLGWDRHSIAYRTLILEQMLTTGGGWQDQFGGIFEGVKLMESSYGFIQKPSVKWAPDYLFTNTASKELILLYYTGINRVAKSILRDIVRGMFLNSASHLEILLSIKQHALYTYEAIQNHDWQGLTAAIGYSWQLNQQLDSGTNTTVISSILKSIEDYTISSKLLGAGGGGYLMIFAKDLQAAGRIRSVLKQSPPNPFARFVDWELSQTGFRLSSS